MQDKVVPAVMAEQVENVKVVDLMVIQETLVCQDVVHNMVVADKATVLVEMVEVVKEMLQVKHPTVIMEADIPNIVCRL